MSNVNIIGLANFMEWMCLVISRQAYGIEMAMARGRADERTRRRNAITSSENLDG